MTWREQLVARILLLIAPHMVCDDLVLAAEIKALSSHIAVHGHHAPPPAIDECGVCNHPSHEPGRCVDTFCRCPED